VIAVLVFARVHLYRDGLAAVFEAEPDVHVVGTAAELGDALAKIAMLDPDVLVIDASFPNSLNVVRAIASAQPRPAIVAVPIPNVPEGVITFAEAGATGYVTREASAADLVEAVKHAANGEILCPPRIVGTLFRRLAVLASERVPAPPIERLTRREREVALLVGEGMSNREIASRLRIEIATVKHHVHNILEKLEVNRRGEAAARIQPDVVLSQ
jgi:two-component system, NarL family, nitrate/nitrite response regulator NarL